MCGFALLKWPGKLRAGWVKAFGPALTGASVTGYLYYKGNKWARVSSEWLVRQWSWALHSEPGEQACCIFAVLYM